MSRGTPLSPPAIHEMAVAAMPNDLVEFDGTVKSPCIRVKPASILPVMRWLRDDPSLAFDTLLLVSGVDYPNRFEVVYHLTSAVHCHSIGIKASLGRDLPEIDSVTPIWPAADWHEREQFDLMGIVFHGHPDLRRILCPDDWEGFPLRKDYRQPESYHGIENQRRIGNDWYPKPDEDEKALVAYRERPAPKAAAPAKEQPADTVPPEPGADETT